MLVNHSPDDSSFTSVLVISQHPAWIYCAGKPRERGLLYKWVIFISQNSGEKIECKVTSRTTIMIIPSLAQLLRTLSKSLWMAQIQLPGVNFWGNEILRMSFGYGQPQREIWLWESGCFAVVALCRVCFVSASRLILFPRTSQHFKSYNGYYIIWSQFQSKSFSSLPLIHFISVSWILEKFWQRCRNGSTFDYCFKCMAYLSVFRNNQFVLVKQIIAIFLWTKQFSSENFIKLIFDSVAHATFLASSVVWSTKRKSRRDEISPGLFIVTAAVVVPASRSYVLSLNPYKLSYTCIFLCSFRQWWTGIIE